MMMMLIIKYKTLLNQNLNLNFLNRIDEQIIFNSLGLKVQIEITHKMLSDLSLRLKSRNILIDFDETIDKYVIKHGYNDEYGARPLKRFIQRQIETIIATKMIEGLIEPHKHYNLHVIDDQLQITENKESE